MRDFVVERRLEKEKKVQGFEGFRKADIEGHRIGTDPQSGGNRSGGKRELPSETSPLRGDEEVFPQEKKRKRAAPMVKGRGDQLVGWRGILSTQRIKQYCTRGVGTVRQATCIADITGKSGAY